jgi:hypothetical protein
VAVGRRVRVFGRDQKSYAGSASRIFANIATKPSRSDSARAAWRALCNSGRSVFSQSSPAPRSDRRRSNNSRVERPLPSQKGVGEVRVVVQVRDSAREICLRYSLELLEAVNLRGDVVTSPTLPISKPPATAAVSRARARRRG